VSSSRHHVQCPLTGKSGAALPLAADRTERAWRRVDSVLESKASGTYCRSLFRSARCRCRRYHASSGSFFQSAKVGSLPYCTYLPTYLPTYLTAGPLIFLTSRRVLVQAEWQDVSDANDPMIPRLYQCSETDTMTWQRWGRYI